MRELILIVVGVVLMAGAFHGWAQIEDIGVPVKVQRSPGQMCLLGCDAETDTCGRAHELPTEFALCERARDYCYALCACRHGEDG